jgi:hypothetical protein
MVAHDAQEKHLRAVGFVGDFGQQCAGVDGFDCQAGGDHGLR